MVITECQEGQESNPVTLAANRVSVHSVGVVHGIFGGDFGGLGRYDSSALQVERLAFVPA